MAKKIRDIPERTLSDISPKKEKSNMSNAIQALHKEEYISIPLSLITAEENIRKQYGPDDKSVKELAESLKAYGQLQPIRVYETSSNGYAILFGHRRYYAAKKAGIEELKCIVCDNPATTDRLYIQAIENEQSEGLSASDREDYITALLNTGEISADICKKMGKSPAWLSQIIKAKTGRDEFGTKFTEAGLELDTYGAYQIAGATPAAVDKAIQAIKETPLKKKAILKEVGLSKLKTSKRGRPQSVHVAQKASPSVLAQSTQEEAIEGVSGAPSQRRTLQHGITIDEEHKSVTLQSGYADSADLTELYTMMNDLVRTYFEKKKYVVIIPTL
jgi:ParB/RepB/Spo0J family partition protein